MRWPCAPALLCAIAVWAACSSESGDTGGKTNEFASMRDYVAADVPKNRDQVVFIGLDGASWGIIDPMIAQGKLPTFKRLKEEGAFGTLRSVDCFFSPPAWVSLYTGYLPENHGVYTFGKWRRDLKEFRSVSSLDIQKPAIWDVASNAGKRVAVTNMAVTHPVHPLNGIMVSGLMTPFAFRKQPFAGNVDMQPATGPFDATLDAQAKGAPLVGTIEMTTSTVVICLYDLQDGRVKYETAAFKVFPTGGDWKISDDVPVRSFALGQYSPWFQMRYKPREDPQPTPVSVALKLLHKGQEAGTGQFLTTPMLRAPSDPDLGLTYPPELGQQIEDKFGIYLIAMSFDDDIIPSCAEETAKFASWFYDYDDWDLFFYTFMAPDNIQHREGFSKRAEEIYQTMDRFLAELIEKLPADATLVIASDHGFKQYAYIIDLNQWLWKLKLFNSPTNPDYRKSLVFHDQWCLYFNDSLLTEPELRKRDVPIAERQSPRQALIEYLRVRGAAIEGAGNIHRSFSVDFVEVPEDGVGLRPDMVVIGGYDDYFVEGGDLSIKTNQVVRSADTRSMWFHDRDGIFMCYGKHIEAGVDCGVRDIQDITPTILYMMDLPLAKDFDGKVIDTIFEPSALAAKNRYYLRNYADLKPEITETGKDLESLEDKLRALGYVR